MQLSHLSRYSKEDLLKISLCEIKYGNKLPFSSLLSQLQQELKAKQIKLKPHVWIGDEWFCPDSISGFAVPFYLLHPTLTQLERQLIGYAEGSNPRWFMKLARHEMGHAMENAYYLRRNKRRQKVFGLSSVPYPESYEPRLYSRQFVKHLGDGYAQAHPDEDFAETFAVWLTPKSNWQQKYLGHGAMEKLLAMDTIMENLAGTFPCNINRQEPLNINQDDRTIGQYYREKRKQLRLTRRKFFTPRLKDVLNPHGELRADQFLRTFEQDICRNVAKQTNQYQYRIKGLFKQMLQECRESNLRVWQQSSRQTVKQVEAAMVEYTPSYLRKGHHRIIM